MCLDLQEWLCVLELCKDIHMIYILKPTDYFSVESQRLKSINIIVIFRSYQYLLNLPVGENIYDGSYQSVHYLCC